MTWVWMAAAAATLVCLAACGGGSSSSTSPSAAPAGVTAPPPTPTPTPRPPNIAGFWDSQARRWHYQLDQSGNTITGWLLGYGNVSYPQVSEVRITGTITTAGHVTFSCPAFDLRFEGDVDASADPPRHINGSEHDCGSGRCRDYGDILDRQ